MIGATISREKHERVLSENARLQRKIEGLQNQLDAVLRLLKTGQSERFVPPLETRQPTLFALPEAQQAPAEKRQVKGHERNIAKEKKPHPGRTPLPEHLERREQVIEPELDAAFEWEKIGEERSEVLEHEPGDLYVRVIVRPKYKKVVAPQHDTDSEVTQIEVAELPSRPLTGSYASASFLAHLIVAKLVDHLPFYRQIKRFKRDHGFELHPSTVNSWFVAVCTLLEPLYNLLLTTTLETDYLQADESRIEVLATTDKDKNGKIKRDKRRTKPRAKKIRRGWMWVVYDPTDKAVVFNYEPARDNAAADALLNDYTGYLQVDGYSAYNHLLLRPGVTYVACAAHVRRKFFDALGNDRPRAETALAFFRRMYEVEGKIRSMASSKQRSLYRSYHLGLALRSFKQWVDDQGLQVTPKSKIGRAIAYAQNRYAGLENVLLDDRLLLDNNLIENQIRPLALGRKNYLFAGSDAGAQRLAMMYTFLGTCVARGVNPYLWLKRVLEVIADTKLTKLAELMPGKLDLS